MPLSAQQSDFIEKFIGVSQKIQKAIAATAAKEGEASRPEAGGVPTGTVKKRAFMIERWKKVPGELKAGVEQLTNGAVQRSLSDRIARSKGKV